MESFVAFMKVYGGYLCTLILVILDIIVLVCNKRPKTLDDFMNVVSEVLLSVPGLCAAVESPGNGELKKKSVFLTVRKIISDKLGRDLSTKELMVVESRCNEIIEETLSAPQKKGA